jgi:hypothetical protein
MANWSKQQLLKMRRNIHLAAKSLDDEQALETPELFPVWAPGVAYLVTERVRYEGQLYRCEQAHTSQEGWEPDKTPAMWTPVAEPWEEWPEWRQPLGVQDAYNEGDKVSHNDKHWISNTNYNTWEPGVYGWDEAEEENNE